MVILLLLVPPAVVAAANLLPVWSLRMMGVKDLGCQFCCPARCATTAVAARVLVAVFI